VRESGKGDVLMLRFTAVLCTVLALGAPAYSQIDEVRVGVAAHDLARNNEAGVQIIVEALFDSPGFLSWAFSPRPYLQGSFNTAGNTNLGSAGLSWTLPATRRLSFEGAAGISYNDGVLDVVHLPPDDPYRIRTAETRALLGSHWLFHLRLGADYALSERWALGVFYEHYSHGQILASGRNQALDEAGVRLGYRFGGR